MKRMSLVGVFLLAGSAFDQDETVVPEPAPAVEEAPAYEAPNDEAKTDEVKTGEAKTDEAKTDEAKTDEAKTDEAKTDEAKTDEAKTDEAKTDEAKTDEAKTDEAKTDEPEKEKLPFIKGNLTSAGANVRIPRRSEYGVRIGFDTIGEDIFLKVSPQIHLIKDTWRLGFHLPLRAPLYSTRPEVSSLLSDQSFTIRPEDYDQAEDFIAAILYAQYGKKEDAVFLNISRVGAASLGHGTILRRFNPNLETDTIYTSLSLDAYTKHGGFQAFASSVTNPYLWGVLGFIKPVGAVSDGDPEKSPAGLRSLSIGLTHVQDMQAPKAIDTYCADGTSTCTSRMVRLDTGNGYLPQVTERSAVSATGIDVEYKAYKSADAKTDLKVYGDVSLLGVEGADPGTGLAVGALARLNFGSGKDTTAMRIRLEGRMFDAKFVPTYFDSLYAQQRYQFESKDGTQSPTKMVWLQGLGEGADADKGRLGYFIDWAFAKPKSYGLQVSYENASVSGGSNDDNRYQHLMVHAEMPLLFLEIFGTYHLRGFDSFDQAFKLDKDNEVLVGAVRWKLFPFLAFNVRAQKNFSTAAYGEGVDSQVRLGEIEGGFKNVWDYGVDCQIGAHY
ncbi:MAG: hypothetical protein OSB21_08815 [Myxococcota bacterium]|nr:hypothetical protein [Myxococcota bacterium]